MAKAVWEMFNGHCGAAGDREVFLISSVGEMHDNPEVVPREARELTDEDREKLTNQGVPVDCQNDDLSITQARIGLDKTLELVRVEVSKPGKELSHGYILKQIEDFLKKCQKPGAIIYYMGHGKQHTGDWCFKDGFITFRDVMVSYNNFLHGRVLTIVSDCSQSGSWVKECCQYLDEQGVRPCGHSAAEKGILLKVYASCMPKQTAATHCFSIHGATNDKNIGWMAYYVDGKKLRDGQNAFGSNFTQVRCSKKWIEDPCTLSPDFTWQRFGEKDRIFLVRGNDHGRPAWHYVLLVDDDQTIKIFKEKTQGAAAGTESIDVAGYGQILKSGWGKDPPNDVKDWIQQQYSTVYE